MNRTQKLLRHINPNGHGVEIGPSHSPIAPKKQGYQVDIIDHMNREQLLVKYEDEEVNLDNIEEVDFVWKGESYAELTGKKKYYDWIIASHVIEHTPDFIGFLKNCEAILKEDGVIALAVPDKRYCFDHHRPITGLSKILDSHFQKNIIHTPGTVAEFFLNHVTKAGCIAWDRNTVGAYRFRASLEEAVQEMKSALHEKDYQDVHAWCFVPHSFRLMIHDLFLLELISLQEMDYFPTKGCEFFITLSPNGKGINRSRLEMLNLIESELKERLSVSTAIGKIKNQVKRLKKRWV
jgi:predicted SAM-dependent methyltransferase